MPTPYPAHYRVTRYATIARSGPDRPAVLLLDLAALPPLLRSRSFAALLRRAPFASLPPGTPVRVLRGAARVYAADKPLGHWQGTEAREPADRSIHLGRYRARPADNPAKPHPAPGWNGKPLPAWCVTLPDRQGEAVGRHTSREEGRPSGEAYAASTNDAT